jgi:4a-hydroxytetrahydrobiopterin dehydratase
MSETLSDLSQKKCKPCEGGIPALSKDEVERYLKKLPGWSLDPAAKVIRAEYVMKNFVAGVKLIQEIARIAESENHHPDLHLTGYRKLVIELTTHAIGGLSENDFILAAKIEQLPKELKVPAK